MDVNIVYSDDIVDVVEYCEVISVSLCKTIVRPKYSRNLPKQIGGDNEVTSYCSSTIF